jgi:hypothetical protein
MKRALSILITLTALGSSGCASETLDVGAESAALSSDTSVTLSLPPQAACTGSCPDHCNFVCEDDPGPSGICCNCYCSGGSGGHDGTILWEILNGESDEAGWDVLAAETGSPLWHIVERDVRGTLTGEIRAPDGTLHCSFDGVRLSDAAGPLYEVRGGQVYRPFGRIPAFTFQEEGVFAGDDELALLTSVDQTDASALRRAAIAALYDGACR